MNRGPDETAVADPDTLELIDVVRLVWRYRILIAACALVCGGAAIYLALTATEIFHAEALVAPRRDTAVGGGTASLVGQLGGLASLAGIGLGPVGGQNQEAQAVLESSRLLDEFVRRNNLVPQIFAGEKPLPSVWRAVQKLQQKVVSVRLDKVTGNSTVAVEWQDPAVAASWANGLVALANELLRARALGESSRNIEYLNNQIAKTNVLEVQKVMYNLIESETKTLMLANARKEYAFTVVDPAVAPEQRVSPKRTLMVITGGGIGLILGGLLALLHSTLTRQMARPQTSGH